MRVVTVAVISFFLGIAGTLIVTPRRSVLAQDPALNNGYMPMVPPLGSDDPVPRVPPLPHIHFSHNTEVGRGPIIVELDGLERTGNVYGSPEGVKFVYGGGAYKLEDNTIVGPISLELTGAAANTLALLEQFGMVTKDDSPTTTPAPVVTPTPAPAAAPPAAKEKHKPITRKKRFDEPLKGDMSSQYDGSEK